MSFSSPSQNVSSSGKSNRKWLIAGGGIAAAVILLCCCVLVIGVFLAIRYDLFSQLFGAQDAAVKVMPADAGIYMGINLSNLTPEKLKRVVDVYAPLLEKNLGEEWTGDPMKGLDESLQEELGLTFSADISPWIGRVAGIGLTELKVDEYGAPESVRFIIAIEAKDTQKADEFIQKLTQAIAKKSGNSFSESTYQDVTLFTLQADSPEEQVVIARSKSLVLFAQNPEDIQAAVDRQPGSSLSDQQSFKTLLKELPGERFLTLYIKTEKLAELTASLQAETGIAPSLQGMANVEVMASLAIVEAGVQMDAVTAYALDQVGADQLELLKTYGGAITVDQIIPENAFFFTAGERIDLTWKIARTALIESGASADVEESMKMLSEQLGFNPDTDLFPYLDKEYALAALPSTEGLLAKQFRINAGLLFLAQTSNEDAVLGTVNKFTAQLEEMDQVIQPVGAEGLQLYEIIDAFSENSVASYGAGKQYLLLGTSAQELQSLFGSGPFLAQNANYQEVWKAFPENTSPAIYLDMQGMLSSIRSGLDEMGVEGFNESIAYLEPIEFIAGGNTPLKDNLAHSILMIFLAEPTR